MALSLVKGGLGAGSVVGVGLGVEVVVGMEVGTAVGVAEGRKPPGIVG